MNITEGEWERVAYHALEVAEECNATSERAIAMAKNTYRVLIPLAITFGAVCGLTVGALTCP